MPSMYPFFARGRLVNTCAFSLILYIIISRMLSSPYSEANGRHRRQPHEEPPARRGTLSAGSRQ